MKKKVLVVSDTHGHLGNFDKVIQKHKDAELIIHLGDVCNDEFEINHKVKCPVLYVRGNNDWSYDLPEKRIFSICGHKIFATHGHRYRVSYGLDTLVYSAMEQECDIVLFGHTHVPLIRREYYFTIVNPGSLTYPRQVGGKPSYVIMNFVDGEVDFKLEYL